MFKISKVLKQYQYFVDKMLGSGNRTLYGILFSLTVISVVIATMITAEAVIAPASYVIYKEGTTIYAQNGQTGVNDYSGADASTVIQSAINNITTTMGKIFIKEGLYYLDSVVNVPKSLVIQGAKSVLYVRNNAAAFNIQSNGTILRDLAIQGVPGYTGYGVEILGNNVSYVTIEDTYAADLTENYLIYIRTPVSSISIRGLHVQNCKGAIKAEYGSGSRDLTLVADTVIANVSESIFRGIDVDKFILTNFYDLVSLGNSIYLQGCNHVTLSGIVGEATNGALINIQPSVSNTRPYRFRMNNIRAHSCQRGIIINDAYSIQLSNFLINNPKRDGISFTGIYSPEMYIVGGEIRDASGDGAGLGYYDINCPIYNAVLTVVGLNIQSANTNAALNLLSTNNVTIVDSFLSNPNAVVTNKAKIARQNISYVTENGGVASVPQGNTSVVVNHGLATTPSYVVCTPAWKTTCWVTNKTATQFTINFGTQTPAGGSSCEWYAEVHY